MLIEHTFCFICIKYCIQKAFRRAKMLTWRNFFPRRYFFCGSFVVSRAFASVNCCVVVTCWERSDHLALVDDVYCIFVTFPCCILGQVWYLIVSFPQ